MMIKKKTMFLDLLIIIFLKLQVMLLNYYIKY